MSCIHCDNRLYIKVKQYGAPILAPLTPAQELRDKLIDLTGENFVEIENKFCAMCGAPLFLKEVKK